MVDIGGDGGQLRLQRSRIRVQRRIGKGGGQLGAQRVPVRAQQNRADAKLRLAGQDHAQRGLADGVADRPCGALPGAR